MVSPLFGPASAKHHDPVAQLSNVSLSYNSIRALCEVHLSLWSHEIHAIVGEHGAGKSTLARILSGASLPTKGAITMDGHRYTSLSIRRSLGLGIRTVYQQIHVNPNFSVAEHMYHVKPRGSGKLTFSRKEAVRRAEQVMERLGLKIPVNKRLGELDPSSQTAVEIAKHLSDNPRMLILDEALERLAAPVGQRIMELLKQYRDAGGCIVFITHRIEDIYTIGDRVTILRQGRKLITDHVANLDKLNLLRMTYTQLTSQEGDKSDTSDFHQLFRYNEAILKQLPVNLIVVDNSLQVRMVNDSFARYFGLTRGHVQQVYLAGTFQNNHRVIELLTNAIPERQEQTFYQVPLTVSGVTVVANIKLFPIWDEQRCIGTIITVEDITQFDRMQTQMILSEKLASIGLLAAGVAHEINNPLAVISNYLTYVRNNTIQPNIRSSINKVQEELQLISHITSNLQAFSDDKVAEIEAFSATAVIQRLIELIQPEARQKSISISFYPSVSEEDRIHCRRSEFKQILLNLFKNSFEALDHGGAIQISTGNVLEEGGTWIEIRFRDDGPGIADSNPNNIFMPFYSTKAERGDKVGLGMSLSYAIVQKYEGIITVRNLVPSGCEFTIRLPAEPYPTNL